MPAPSIVTQIVQFGVESSYGVAVAATKRFAAMGVEPSIATDIAKYRAAGSKYDSLTALNKESVEGSVDGLATYTEMMYALASAIGNMTSVAVPASSCFRHSFYSKNRGRDSVASYTIEKGDPSQGGRRASGCIFNELGIKFSHDGIEVTGSVLGKALQLGVAMSGNEVQSLTTSVVGGAATGGTFTITFDTQTTAAIPYNATPAAVQTALELLSNIAPGDIIVGGSPGAWTVSFIGAYAQSNVNTMTTSGTLLTGPGAPYTVAVATVTPGAAPTELALIPLLPTQTNIYLNDTHAAIGTTQLLGVMSVEFKIGNRQAPFWPLNRALGTSFSELLESVPTLTATITMANDDDADDLVTAMRNGATKFLRVDAVGPIANAAVPYGFEMDLALAIADHGGFSEEDPVYAAGAEFTAVNDPVWGRSNGFSLTNLATTL